MQIQKVLLPLTSLALLAASYHYYGWRGVAVASGGLVMWLLLHFSRMMQILKRAANRPIGHVGSAVMLNAKLKPGVTLLHVVAMTKSLGALQSPKDTQPELYRWTDAGESYVTCEFQDGKLKKWHLVRPVQPAEAANDSAQPPAP